jgi:hypothetical protein
LVFHVFENVMMRIFGTEREEVTERYKKLPVEE